MKLPWSGFSLAASPHSWVMIIWMASARRTDSAVGVVTASSIGVGVQAVGIVVDGTQGLEGGADVVEGHLLGVE